jgi:hypothetical protein
MCVDGDWGRDNLRCEGEADLGRGEVPLSENKGEAVETGEDEGVAGTAEQREEGDNGLGQEELVRSPHELENILGVEALEEAAPDLVGAVDVQVLTRLAAAGGFMVEEDRGTSLWDEEEVDSLDDNTKDELGVEDPAPVEVLGDEAADNRGNNGTAAGGEDDVEHGELLVLGTEHVCDHAKGDTAASRREAAEDTGGENGVEASREDAGELEDVDEEERGLHDPLAAEFFGEGGPEFTTETVGDEEGHLTETGLEVRDAKVLGHAGDSVGVDGGIVVHADLNPEDNGKNGPLLTAGEGKAELGGGIGVLVSQLDARVGVGGSKTGGLANGDVIVGGVALGDGGLTGFLGAVVVRVGRVDRGSHGGCVGKVCWVKLWVWMGLVVVGCGSWMG